MDHGQFLLGICTLQCWELGEVRPYVYILFEDLVRRTMDAYRANEFFAFGEFWRQKLHQSSASFCRLMYMFLLLCSCFVVAIRCMSKFEVHTLPAFISPLVCCLVMSVRMRNTVSGKFESLNLFEPLSA